MMTDGAGAPFNCFRSHRARRSCFSSRPSRFARNEFIDTAPNIPAEMSMNIEPVRGRRRCGRCRRLRNNGRLSAATALPRAEIIRDADAFTKSISETAPHTRVLVYIRSYGCRDYDLR